MAGHEIGVSPAKLRNTSESIEISRMKMKSSLDSIAESVLNLKGLWQGEAADQLAQISGNMSGTFEEFQKAVRGFTARLDTFATNYENAEKTNVSNQESASAMFKTV